ncbi:MAG: GNAT family N-acetyltransferase [Firmicutes bacterium]|jgi:ribosomal protein S18 acetylase RimI-like enzyme|nr:GNAT family N-acetyltransferase [Bacillota bacterium]
MNFARADENDLKSSALRELVSCSFYRADDTKMAAFLHRAFSGKTRTYLAVDGADLLGHVTVAENGELGPGGGLTIESMSVRAEYRRKGVGRFLLHGLRTRLHARVMVVETDDDAVGFYHRCGFRVRSLGEVYPGTVRYRCRYDETAWAPLPYRDAIDSLQRYGVRAWVAGGWALDLFHGRQTRAHADTDIVICRRDQNLLFAAFPGWEVYRTQAPGLALWTGDNCLQTAPNVWLRGDQDSPWSLEVMFLDTEGDAWIYRRNTSIRGPIDDVGLVTSDGVPYLRPEIQLLYKGGSSDLREKDTKDLLNILPILPEASRSWLRRSLLTQFPQGHIGWTTLTSSQPGGLTTKVKRRCADE